MKTFHSFFFLAGLVGLSLTAGAQRLTVVITGVRDSAGRVGAAIYDSEKEFLKREIRSAGIPATKGEVRIVFENLPPGNYAVSVLHDLNDNKKMDTSLMGIPKEGFGFSNDARGTFGPPSFGKAIFFYAGKDETIRISMRYFF